MRLSQLFHRSLQHRTNSRTCSLCGVSRLSYWFCTHCHLSLCPSCHADAKYPDELQGECERNSSVGVAESGDCRTAFAEPHLDRRASLPARLTAGGPSDQSIVLAPVVVVCILGLPNTRAENFMSRHPLFQHGYGTYLLTISVPSNLSLKSFQERLADVAELLRNIVAEKFVLDIRCHSIPTGLYFNKHVTFTPRALFRDVIEPLLAARLSRIPHAASAAPSLVARHALVALQACSVAGTTYRTLAQDMLARLPGSAIEFLTLGEQLLISDIDALLPQLLPEWCNRLRPSSTPEMLYQVLSPRFLAQFALTFIAPDPVSQHYELTYLRSSLPVLPLVPLGAQLPLPLLVPPTPPGSLFSDGPSALLALRAAPPRKRVPSSGPSVPLLAPTLRRRSSGPLLPPLAGSLGLVFPAALAPPAGAAAASAVTTPFSRSPLASFSGFDRVPGFAPLPFGPSFPPLAPPAPPAPLKSVSKATVGGPPARASAPLTSRCVPCSSLPACSFFVCLADVGSQRVPHRAPRRPRRPPSDGRAWFRLPAFGLSQHPRLSRAGL